MIQKERLLNKLKLLKEERELSKSQCGRQFLNFVRPLFAANVITEQRSGAGRKLVVGDIAVLQAFIDHNFPDVKVSDKVLQRVVGVQRFRDSKVFASDNPELVHVRAWGENVLIKNKAVVDAVRETATHSVFSFQLSPLYTLHGRCALVEGPVMFSSFERLGLDVALVVYGEGRLSKRILEWLANQTHPNFSLAHLPDYDPVGLNDFERIRASLGTRAHLHIPLNLEDLFKKYSKRELLEKRKSQILLRKLRSSNSPEVQKVVGFIDKHNAGLEQEALLIDNWNDIGCTQGPVSVHPL
jgi:hypothetical protein